MFVDGVEKIVDGVVFGIHHFVFLVLLGLRQRVVAEVQLVDFDAPFGCSTRQQTFIEGVGSVDMEIGRGVIHTVFPATFPLCALANKIINLCVDESSAFKSGIAYLEEPHKVTTVFHRAKHIALFFVFLFFPFAIECGTDGAFQGTAGDVRPMGETFAYHGADVARLFDGAGHYSVGGLFESVAKNRY